MWSLEKKVDELELKVLRLEDRESHTAERAATTGGVEDKLQAEVTWLKRGLEEHLRMFKNVFSNADLLEKTQATLELDKLWQLMKTKDAEKEKQKPRGERRGVRQRPRKGGETRSPSGSQLHYRLSTPPDTDEDFFKNGI